MHDKDDDPTGNAAASSGSGFMKTVFGFFSEVLKSIATDDFLRVLWGVEVLLFIILVFMIWFGDISAEQRFLLALIIVASVVVTFVVSAWRLHRHGASRHAAPAGSLGNGRQVLPQSPTGGAPEVVEQARRCLALLTEIEAANGRVIQRGLAGSGPWAKIQRDTYNEVCRTCHERRLGGQPPDNYLDVICAEPDVIAVCKRKWELGEALDVYRSRLERASPALVDHDNLELLVRQSVTQPNCSPAELQDAVKRAIERAESLV